MQNDARSEDSKPFVISSGLQSYFMLKIFVTFVRSSSAYEIYRIFELNC